MHQFTSHTQSAPDTHPNSPDMEPPIEDEEEDPDEEEENEEPDPLDLRDRLIEAHEEGARRDANHAEILEMDRDAYDAQRAKIDADYPSVPPEVDEGIGGPVKTNTVWGARTYTAMKAEGLVAKTPKWFGYKGSALLTKIETWGRDVVKKNAPWVGAIPLVGSWMIGDVKKTWAEREKEENKKKDEDEKKARADREKAKSDQDKKRKDDEASLKKTQEAEKKRVQAQDKTDEANRLREEKELLEIMSPKERYDFQHANEWEKKALLEKAAEALPAHKDKLARREYQDVLKKYMSPEEVALIQTEVPNVDGIMAMQTLTDDERAERLRARLELVQRQEDLMRQVEGELEVPWRQQIAEKQKGGQQKGKSKGPGGPKGNGGGGRGRS